MLYAVGQKELVEVIPPSIKFLDQSVYLETAFRKSFKNNPPKKVPIRVPVSTSKGKCTPIYILL
jgi:hypothetical protein